MYLRIYTYINIHTHIAYFIFSVKHAAAAVAVALTVDLLTMHGIFVIYACIYFRLYVCMACMHLQA